MKHLVILTMVVEADSSGDAMDLGIAAAEHLNDTFNDNESIEPLMRVEVQPVTKDH